MADETETNDMLLVFEMSGRRLVFDADPTILMGDEAMLLDDQTGGVKPWIARLENGEPTSRDLLVLAFLGAHRENPQLEWHYFVRGVAPYTLKVLSIGGDSVPASADQPATPAPRSRSRKAPTAKS
jgi:hypothetical protein